MDFDFAIEVLPEESRNGNFADSRNCPIAKALNRLHPGQDISVSPYRARIGNMGDSETIYLKLLNGDLDDIEPYILKGERFTVNCKIIDLETYRLTFRK